MQTALVHIARAFPQGRPVHDRLLEPAAPPYDAVEEERKAMNAEGEFFVTEREALKVKKEELESALGVVKSDIELLQRKHDVLNSDYKTVNFQLDTSISQCNMVRIKKKELESELGVVKSDIKALQARHDALDADHTALKTQLEVSNAKIEALNSAVSAKDGQIQYLIEQYDTQYVSAAEKFLAEKGFVRGAMQGGVKSGFSPGRVLLDAHIDSASAFRFMDLPGELRNRIYEFALVLDHPLDLWPMNGLALGLSNMESKPAIQSRDEILQKDIANINVDLLRVSKQVYQETVGMLYGHNTFQFSGHRAFVPMTAFLRHIGSGCKFLTAISVQCSSLYSETGHLAWKLKESANEFMQEGESALDAFYRRLRVAGYYSIIGSPWDEEGQAILEGDRILRKLPALRYFTMLVPHAIRIRTDSYLMSTGSERKDFMLRYEAGEQKKQFAAATAAGNQVERTVVFIKRHATQSKRYKMYGEITDLDDEKEMGWEDFKKVKEHWGWKIKHATYTMQPDGPAFTIDKPKPLLEEHSATDEHPKPAEQSEPGSTDQDESEPTDPEDAEPADQDDSDSADEGDWESEDEDGSESADEDNSGPATLPTTSTQSANAPAPPGDVSQLQPTTVTTQQAPQVPQPASTAALASLSTAPQPQAAAPATAYFPSTISSLPLPPGWGYGKDKKKYIDLVTEESTDWDPRSVGQLPSPWIVRFDGKQILFENPWASLTSYEHPSTGKVINLEDNVQEAADSLHLSLANFHF
ncbi:uncharacterized protein BDZ99DRAFT_518151 [Mytilinidion resinicola]|uniref:DUF7730 domain-containing protein n=1 Tax=Mytilinidion resinicola TaxID=574789 RepID=A0A6A6YV84_9PEZI|nr:uncharacterized protein BDZ99DRAFT_518151 [Mytilinidion resinicola]KAF2812293.1 hypothetical protein BDZ99DRAFT_518151 [Mytilinidion resinicola]